MKILYEFLINLFAITDIWWLDVILTIIIGFIAYIIAFKAVGAIFDSIGFYESKIMSIVHWTIRIVVFVGISLLLGWIIQFFKWFLALQWWAITLILVGAIMLIIGIIIIIYRIKH